MLKEKPQSLLVAVSADGAMKIGGRTLVAGDEKALLALFRKTAADRSDTTVVIAADGKTTHQSVVSIMEAAREAGLTQLTFATQASHS
jgi:biopolymer transport protein ExbD